MSMIPRTLLAARLGLAAFPTEEVQSDESEQYRDEEEFMDEMDQREEVYQMQRFRREQFLSRRIPFDEDLPLRSGLIAPGVDVVRLLSSAAISSSSDFIPGLRTLIGGLPEKVRMDDDDDDEDEEDVVEAKLVEGAENAKETDLDDDYMSKKLDPKEALAEKLHAVVREAVAEVYGISIPRRRGPGYPSEF